MKKIKTTNGRNLPRSNKKLKEANLCNITPTLKELSIEHKQNYESCKDKTKKKRENQWQKEGSYIFVWE